MSPDQAKALHHFYYFCELTFSRFSMKKNQSIIVMFQEYI